MKGKLGDLGHKVSSFFAFLAAAAATIPAWAPYRDLAIFISAALGAGGAVTNAMQK